jgi:glycosylphosphatidylinositol deacylase
MSFAESLNQSLQGSIPFTLAALSLYAVYLANMSRLNETATSNSQWPPRHHVNSTATAIDYTRNDYLLGSDDAAFWFLVPVFSIISIGLCIAINYFALAITHILTMIYSSLRASTPRNEDGRFVFSSSQWLKPQLTHRRRTPSAFAVTSTRQRVLTTSVLLLLVSTVIPYQFAFLVLCIVQIASCIRALRVARETVSFTLHCKTMIKTNEYPAFGCKLQLLQLRTLYSCPNALDSPH